MLTVLGYLADLWILATYALLARTGRPRAFHCANAIGCIPLLTAEALTHLWPVMLLTGAFGAIGWVGLIQDRARVSKQTLNS